MPVIDHIDAEARRVYLSSDTVGVDFDPMVAYTEMRDLRKTDETLRPFDVFLKGLGKIPKSPGKYTERYTMLQDGCLLVPYNTTHILTVIGTVITDAGQEGALCFDKSLIDVTSNVDIHYQPPQVEIIEIETGGGTGLTEEQAAALDMTRYQEKSVFIDTERLVNGDGSALDPFNTVTDTTDFAEDNNIKKVVIYADADIDRNVKNFTCIGVGSPRIDCGGHNLQKTEFHTCTMAGDYTSDIKVFQSILDDGFYLNGGFKECGVIGRHICKGGASVIIAHCFKMPDSQPFVISLEESGSNEVNLQAFHGDVTIENMTDQNDTVEITATGFITIDSSCTEGTIVIVGTYDFEDNSGANCSVNVVSNASAKAFHKWNIPS